MVRITKRMDPHFEFFRIGRGLPVHHDEGSTDRRQSEPRDPIRPILWLFNDYVPKGGIPKGQDYIEDANRDRKDAALA
jgi:hypothetical protein